MKKSIFVAAFAFIALAAAAQNTKEAPPKPPPPQKPPVSKAKDVPPPPQEELPEDYAAFLKRNETVASLGWNAENEVIIHLKSGKEERYNLDDESSRKAAVARYGELPVAPPPPPPLAPPPPPKPPKKRAITTS